MLVDVIENDYRLEAWLYCSTWFIKEHWMTTDKFDLDLEKFLLNIEHDMPQYFDQYIYDHLQ